MTEQDALNALQALLWTEFTLQIPEGLTAVAKVRKIREEMLKLYPSMFSATSVQSEVPSIRSGLFSFVSDTFAAVLDNTGTSVTFVEAMVSQFNVFISQMEWSEGGLPGNTSGASNQETKIRGAETVTADSAASVFLRHEVEGLRMW